MSSDAPVPIKINQVPQLICCFPLPELSLAISWRVSPLVTSTHPLCQSSKKGLTSQMSLSPSSTQKRNVTQDSPLKGETA